MSHPPYSQCELQPVEIVVDSMTGETVVVIVPAHWTPPPELRSRTLYERVAAAAAGGNLDLTD